jgi:hypothetical protein
LAETLSCGAVIDRGLIERYLAGTLSEAEVEAFESHYLTCTRCQNDLRMAAAIRDVLPEVQEASRTADASTAGVTGRWFGRRERIAAIAVAIAAVLAGIVLVRPSTIDSLRHRDTVPDTEMVPVVEAPVGEVEPVEEFRWTAVTAADLYRVTLYDAAGDVIWQVEARETHVALAVTVRLEPGALYLWGVDARVDWDRWVSSELVRFRISEP